MSLTAKLSAKFAQRQEENLGCRGDLFLADHQELNANVARVMVGYDSYVGAPTADDVRQFFTAHFQSSVIPKLETAAIYKDENAVTVVAELWRPSRPFSDTNDMLTVVANVRYVDTVMNDTWEVKEGADGQKFLSRICAENIGEILNERRQRMQVKAGTSKLTIASLLSTGMHYLNVGDIVRCMVDNKVVSDAEVTQVSGASIKVKVGGQAFDVPKEAVLNLQHQGMASKEAARKRDEEYFAKAYGDPNYAKQLVK